MTESQMILEQQDVGLLFTIFAILACILPIYGGFKKSQAQGIINMSIVAAVLFLYFNIPTARSIITIIFVSVVIIGVVVQAKQSLFP